MGRNNSLCLNENVKRINTVDFVWTPHFLFQLYSDDEYTHFILTGFSPYIRIWKYTTQSKQMYNRPLSYNIWRVWLYNMTLYLIFSFFFLHSVRLWLGCRVRIWVSNIDEWRFDRNPSSTRVLCSNVYYYAVGICLTCIRNNIHFTTGNYIQNVTTCKLKMFDNIRRHSPAELNRRQDDNAV